MKPEEIAQLAKRIKAGDLTAVDIFLSATRRDESGRAYYRMPTEKLNCTNLDPRFDVAITAWAAWTEPASERQRLASWVKNPDRLQISESSIKEGLDRIAELLLADDEMAKRAGEIEGIWLDLIKDDRPPTDELMGATVDILRHFAEAR